MRREREHLEQRALFRWAAMHEARLPELGLLFAVPNGRKRTAAEAGKLKAEGVKSGVPDVWLPVPRQGYHGLVIEMKAPGKLANTSEAQDRWIERLQDQGWCVGVCDRWQHAWNLLARYLGHPDLVIAEHLIPPL